MMEPRVKQYREKPLETRAPKPPEQAPIVLHSRAFREDEHRDDLNFLRVFWDGDCWLIWEPIMPLDIVAVFPPDAPVRPVRGNLSCVNSVPICLGQPGRYAFTFYLYRGADE